MCQRYTLSLFALAAVLLSCQPDDSHVAACDLPDADGGFLYADSSVVAYPHLARAAVISEDVYTGWIVVRPGGTIPVHSHGVEHEIAFITCGGGERHALVAKHPRLLPREPRQSKSAAGEMLT